MEHAAIGDYFLSRLPSGGFKGGSGTKSGGRVDKDLESIRTAEEVRVTTFSVKRGDTTPNGLIFRTEPSNEFLRVLLEGFKNA